MFMKSVKNKFKSILSAVLALTIMSQIEPLTVFAGTNGGGTWGSGGGTLSDAYEFGWDSGLAIFLYKGDEVILDNFELNLANDTSKTAAYNNSFNTGMKDHNLNYALGQVFRRTYVSWRADDVWNSILFLGRNNGFSNAYSKITRVYYNPPEQVNSSQLVTFKESGYSKLDDYFATLASKEKTTNWDANSASVKGKGLYKAQIVDYLKKWFGIEGSTTETPHQFIDRLIKNATDTDKITASRIWTYIASGVDNLSERDDPSRDFKGNIQLSPSERWSKIFEGDNSLSWDEIYLTADGVRLLPNANGTYQEIPNWDESDLGPDQVAGYLDSLITVALMAQHSGNSTAFVNQYIKAAKEVFGSSSSYAKHPNELTQTHALSIQRTYAQNYFRQGDSTADPFDAWAIYMGRAGRTSFGTEDFRSANPYYNDAELHPLVKNSPGFKSWAGGVTANGEIWSNEDLSRIALRLQTQSGNSTKLKIGDSNTEMSMYSGSALFAHTASLLGKLKGMTKDYQIFRGVGDSSYGNLSGSEGMVGPQFVVGMFGHMATTPLNSMFFTHSLTATPKEEIVEPNAATGTLGKKPTVEYKLGTGFNKKLPDKTAIAVNDVASTTAVINTIRDAQIKDTGAELQIRYSFSSRIRKYYIKQTGLPGDKVIKNETASGDTGWVSITEGVRLSSGHTPIKTVEFSGNAGWGKISRVDFETLLKKNNSTIFTYYDERFIGYEWTILPDAKTTESGTGAITTITYHYPGADYYFVVDYKADTQIRLKYSNGTFMEISYDASNASDPSVTKMGGLSSSNKLPVALAKANTGKYEAATDYASYKYTKESKTEAKTVINVEKEPIPYAVYSSSPEAYAELKNWGVSSTNEPGDASGLGDGRSPVDTAAGVNTSYKSNGSTLITEDYEVMAGVPTTEKLYLAVGGSEFIVDIAVQYVPNETAIRAYTTHFDGVACQFNYASASGAGGDTTAANLWTSIAVPQPKNVGSSVTATVTTSNGNQSINPHEGGTYTLTLQGTIHNEGEDGKKVISDHDGGTYAHKYGNGPFDDRAPAAAQGSNGSGSQLIASEAAKGNGMPLSGSQTVTRVPNTVHDSPQSWSWAVPKVSDVNDFNNMMDGTVKQWIDDMVVYFQTVPSFTSGSDKVTRKLGEGTVGSFTYTKNNLQDNIIGYPSTTPHSGSLTVTAPTDLFRFDDGRGSAYSFNAVKFTTNTQYKATNPTNKSATTSSSCNGVLRQVSYKIEAKSTGTTYGCTGYKAEVTEQKDKDGNITRPYEAEVKCTASDSGYSNSNTWTATITGQWTDGHDVEWFAETTEGKAEYKSFEDAYKAAQQAADAWCTAEEAKTEGTCSHGYNKQGVGSVSASHTDTFTENAVAFKACTASNETHAVKDTDKTWTAQYTFTVEPHILCGPCCNHNLPEINDTWQQSYNYDYLKIIGLAILRLDQGSAADTSVDGSGLKALIGTSKLGVTRQTFYSGPSFNIAQANIFNYMGLQTDGTLDVTKATNEYFRSIAVGVNSAGSQTTYGNTRSSEAGRVRYWMLNNDGSQITAKGPTFDRLVYTGNTASSQKFANELSSWQTNYGIFDAHDLVQYNFGNRSNTCDGTSRGYQYNINKRSWLETVDGVVRGKAAYDLPWATGFIYDGIGAAGSSGAASNTTTIGMVGFSVSNSYRNTGTSSNTSGIYQPSTKGWQGTGVTSSAKSTKVNAYEEAFVYNYADTMNALKYPIHLDWGDSQHNKAYTDTRQLVLPKDEKILSGLVWPDAADGDKSPRKTAYDTYAALTNPPLSGNPYNSNEFLTSYTNTAKNSAGVNKAQATNEYKLMLAKRQEKVQATVVSDMLFLETAQGVQPIIYHYKNAGALAEVDERIPDTRISFDKLWRNNVFSPNGWTTSTGGTIKDSVVIGGFNGVISTQSVASYENQTKFNERADEVLSTVISSSQISAAENNSGKIGSVLGAKTLNSRNINSYINRDSVMRIATYYTNNVSTSPTTNRTLLYNISPLVLSAENRAYSPGVAEVFWETIVLWKDSSNHDYYSDYPDPDINTNSSKKFIQYLAPGQFVRLPELLGNYGQIARDETQHTFANGETLLKDWFKDTDGKVAYGAENAIAAQAEQYARGFSVTGYNYDTTNKEKVNGKTWSEMYNGSANLTGSAKGQAYTTGGSAGVPFILEGVYNTNFNTTTATRRIGQSGALAIAKSGYIQQAAYTKSQGDKGVYKLNQIIIHTPVTARAVQIMPLADWRDQRVTGQSSVALVRKSQKVGCPGLAELCQFSVLACKYEKDMTFLSLDFVGSGNSVPNTALNAKTTGKIILAGNFVRTSTGLSSGGSTRSGVSLSSLGADYVSAMNYRVTATGINYSSGSEQMLFGFEKYGITLNPTTQKLYIRVDGCTAYLEVSGTFTSGSDLTVEFGSSNAAQSKVWVNGSLRTLTPLGGAASTMTIGSGQIGDTFYLGAWNVASSPTYALSTSTRIRGITLERLRGSTSHGADCASTITRHIGGNNAHVHDSSHLGSSSSTAYLNGTLNAYNNSSINASVLQDRLGTSVYNSLMNLSLVQTLINESVSINTTTTVKDFSYTGGMQSFTAPVAGTYTLEAWGAQGGGATPNSAVGSRGGAGGYSKGEVYLNAGETIYIGVGGQGTVAGTYSAGQAEVPGIPQTFNYTGSVQSFTATIAGTYTFEVWGAQGANGNPNVGGGLGGYSKGTYTLAANQTIYIYVGGQGSGSTGGYNGGGTGGLPGTASGATTPGGGGGGASDIRIGGTTLSNRVIVAGGGGGAAGNPNSHGEGNGHGGAGGGSTGDTGTRYMGTAGEGGTQTAGGAAGTGYAPQSQTSGSQGSGGNGGGYGGGAGGGGYYGGGGGGGTYSPYNDGSGGGGGSGYIGGVSNGSMDSGIKSGNGKVVITPPTTPAVPTGYYGPGGGGYNGGGNGYSGTGNAVANAGAAGYGGGGATHFSKSNTVLSGLNGNRTNVLLVAGGGGGSDDITGESAGQPNDGSGGSGGGTTGGDAYVDGSQRANTGGTQTTGNAFGQGASATTATDTGGGGGGWFGGFATNHSNGGGGGGSGYTGGTSNSSMQNGIRLGNGAARITYVVFETKTYTITVPAGGKCELDAITTLTSGNPILTIYKGTTLTSANQIAFNDDYSGIGLNSRIIIRLDPGTYTLVAGSNYNGVSNYNLKVTLKRTYFTYGDIMGLPNINGQEAWRSIPFYLPDGTRNPVWSCNGEANKHVCNGCYEETTYDKCTEPHHIGQHYEHELCFDPCMDDDLHNTQFVQDKNVNTPAAEFVSIDWDYTLYASTLDNFRGTFNYQLTSLAERTGRGYIEDEDAVRFTRGKYVRFPWYVLYEGVLYAPGQWITLGDRGDYKAGMTNNSTGYGGDVQGGSASTNSLWNGEQAAAYNVQNWSLYGQPIYQDLYKDFYDFYVPLANDEMSLGECIYAVVAVNASTEKTSKGTPIALGDVNIWNVNNKSRSNYTTKYGASKYFYVDLVGRIGGYVIQDTTDVKFSNTFKEARTATEDKRVVFGVNISNLNGENTLQASSLANISATGISLKALGDWAGFDFNGDNERNFTLTIYGNYLKACELEINIGDAHNGDYVLRTSDMTVTENTDGVFIVSFSVKPTESSVILKPRLRLIDNTVEDVCVTSMVLDYGGTGYSHGLSKDVDQTKQNYYVTDVTDVRGVYLAATNNLNNGTESWIRYGTYGSTGRSQNWVRLTDATQVRDSSGISQRKTPEYGTRAVNTYGTRPWVQINDQFYYAWADAGGRALRGPLTSSHNVIAQYQTPEDQLSIGSHVLYDITTLGSYYSQDSRLEIIPTYYAVDLTKRNADGSVVLAPVDIYQLAGTGEYAEVNIFGAAYGGFSNTDLDKFNRYRLDVNWGNEAVGEFNRRNVTPREYEAALEFSNTFGDPIYDTSVARPAGVEGPWQGEFKGYGASWRKVPEGIIPVGGAQLVSQDYRTQTYIGSNRTYGVAKDGGTFSGVYASNPTNHPRYLYWEISAQRWHTVLGLPSDSVFVPLDYTNGKYSHPAKSEIQSKALDIEKTLIIVYIDVYAYGDVWTLRYGNNGIERKITIDNEDYLLPTGGPPGPGTSTPYPGAATTSNEEANPGIPFVIFGGAKVPDMADIIKVN